MPVFGIRVPGCRYTVRPSAYAVLRDEDGRIAVVRAARGWFLPGGGIDAGETAEEAVRREAIEECGLVIRLGRAIGSATEIVHSPAGNDGVEKESVFFEATVAAQADAVQPEHEVAWLSAADAMGRLSHRSHKWALTSSAAP
jgi:8-oxo-dGTP diphosphatase